MDTRFHGIHLFLLQNCEISYPYLQHSKRLVITNLIISLFIIREENCLIGRFCLSSDEVYHFFIFIIFLKSRIVSDMDAWKIVLSDLQEYKVQFTKQMIR